MVHVDRAASNYPYIVWFNHFSLFANSKLRWKNKCVVSFECFEKGGLTISLGAKAIGLLGGGGSPSGDRHAYLSLAVKWQRLLM